MTERPLVSIVIPVYNRETLVKEAISSALAQTYDNIEIVVVDNCSTDNTWSIVSSYHSSKLRVYRNDRNVGPVLNWKRGIELSNGEYIKLLFSDDLISENFIEESLKLFDERTAFVLSPIQYLKNEIYGMVIPYWKDIYTPKEYFTSFYTQFSEVFPVSPGASIFRKDDIEKAFIYEIPTMGNLDPMKNGAGIDLLIYFSIANKYDKIKVAQNSRAIFRAHEESFSVADSAIRHYYFRAMIFFLHFINHKKLAYYFTFFLFLYLYRDSSYHEEYNLLRSNNRSTFKTFFLLPQFFFLKSRSKLQRKIKSK